MEKKTTKIPQICTATECQPIVLSKPKKSWHSGLWGEDGLDDPCQPILQDMILDFAGAARCFYVIFILEILVSLIDIKESLPESLLCLQCEPRPFQQQVLYHTRRAYPLQRLKHPV